MKIPDFLARHFPHHETHKAAAPYALSSLGTAAVGITLTLWPLQQL